MRRDRDRLLDILEAIENIQVKMVSDRESFYKDKMLQVWVIYHIQIIGEAAARVSEELRNSHTDIPWPDIISMRNILVHQYFGIDTDQIWDTATDDLPKIKSSISELLKETS